MGLWMPLHLRNGSIQLYEQEKLPDKRVRRTGFVAAFVLRALPAGRAPGSDGQNNLEET